MQYRIAILTESHKIYITERCREDDAPEQARRDGWIFKHYERPNEDTEKLLNWDIGEEALCYTTEDGKAYENPNIRRRGHLIQEMMIPNNLLLLKE